MSAEATTISFDKVLVTDGMAWTLFGMAHREGMLYSRQGEAFVGRPPRFNHCQAVLSLLVLFDQLVVHDLSPSPGAFRIPDLERDGLLEIVAATEPAIKIPPLESFRKPSKSDPRGRPPVPLRRSLALLQLYKPLVVDRLMTVANSFDSYMARQLRMSRRAYYSEFLDLATNYALGRTDLLRQNPIERAIPRKLLNEIKRELFDFQMRGELLGPSNVTLLAALLFADELGTIREVSAARGLGVATRYYGRVGRVSREPRDGFTVDPSQVPNSFGLVRSILHEEGHFFPQIQSIAHALKLRKDPHLRAFREQLREFHGQLARGDREALEQVRKEVALAKRILERTANWNLALRWLTYISLPAGLAESLLVGAPIVGTSLAVMSALGTMRVHRASRQNEWVMFGV